MWQPQSVGQGYWFGPLKVANQEGTQSVWGTMQGKLHRRARMFRRSSPIQEEEMTSITTPTTSAPEIIIIPNPQPNSHENSEEEYETSNPENSSQSQDQPDGEPDNITPEESQNNPPENNSHAEIPIPDDGSEDGLITTHLLCVEDEIMSVDPTQTPCAWRFELDLPSHRSQSMSTADEVLLATCEKKQRTEVKLSMLSPEEVEAFQKAKDAEIQNWLSTGTVSKILKNKLAPEQILCCRWILTWKPLEKINRISQSIQTSPQQTQGTFGCAWLLGSQSDRSSQRQSNTGKTIQDAAVATGVSLRMEPCFISYPRSVPPRKATTRQNDRFGASKRICISHEAKSAYGLMDAPYLWCQTLQQELVQLNFIPSPFGPCLLVLRNPKTQKLAGILGIYVDDGIYGGDAFFHEQIAKLEQKYPFGTKKSRSCAFTGIELHQRPDNSIEMSQSKYVKNISPITLTPERRSQEDQPVTEKERHLLRHCNMRRCIPDLTYVVH